MLNLNSVFIGTKHPAELAAFYEKVFGKPPDMTNSDYGLFGWHFGAGNLAVLTHFGMDGNAKEPGRLMLNFETTEVQAEFERIKALGGAVVAEPYQIGEAWIATLADPEGNYFQLVSPMEM
jgi:predicted enzyme related to lactoylglutathione lyase